MLTASGLAAPPRAAPWARTTVAPRACRASPSPSDKPRPAAARPPPKPPRPAPAPPEAIPLPARVLRLGALGAASALGLASLTEPVSLLLGLPPCCMRRAVAEGLEQLVAGGLLPMAAFLGVSVGSRIPPGVGARRPRRSQRRSDEAPGE